MSASVIERFAVTIDDKGFIHYDDRPGTYERAEAIVGKHLDRRRNYAIIDGNVYALARWTSKCSGCSDDPYDDAGGGCSECGHTGRVRQGFWFPVSVLDMVS